jgi:DNA-binding beta-propeller fold protein YncE
VGASRVGLEEVTIPAWILPSLMVLLAAGASPKPTAPLGYRIHRTIPLPGDEGWDRLTVDPDARRLYLTRSSRVVVLDLEKEKVVGEIRDTPGVHGVAVAKELKRGFVSDGGRDDVTIFDLQTLDVLGRAPAGREPDAILYDAASSRIFALNRGSGDATAVDAAAGTAVGTIELGGRPGSAVADGLGTVFVAIEDRNELAAFDSRQLAVRSRWPLAPCEAPTALAMDRTKRRLFVGCGNQLMAVVDAVAGSVLATLPIGRGVGGAAFDDGRKLAFASNDDGTLTVVREDAPGHFVVVESATTLPGARTMTLDPKTHRLYLATARFGAPPPKTPENPHPRGPMVPGTFVVMVFIK